MLIKVSFLFFYRCPVRDWSRSLPVSAQQVRRAVRMNNSVVHFTVVVTRSDTESLSVRSRQSHTFCGLPSQPQWTWSVELRPFFSDSASSQHSEPHPAEPRQPWPEHRVRSCFMCLGQENAPLTPFEFKIIIIMRIHNSY